MKSTSKYEAWEKKEKILKYYSTFLWSFFESPNFKEGLKKLLDVATITKVFVVDYAY